MFSNEAAAAARETPVNSAAWYACDDPVQLILSASAVDEKAAEQATLRASLRAINWFVRARGGWLSMWPILRTLTRNLDAKKKKRLCDLIRNIVAEG